MGDSTDLDAWWQPQPHATLEPEEAQERPAQPLAQALSCTLCHELLKEAMTSPECGHSCACAHVHACACVHVRVRVLVRSCSCVCACVACCR